MGFLRNMLMDGGLARASRSGDGLLASPAITVVAADANDILTVAKMAGGIVQYTSFTAGRNLTTDTAVNILAAFTNMDIGDVYVFCVSCVAAFAGTYVAGVGVTLAGRATTPASSYSLIAVTKLTATTVEWRVL